MKTVLYGESRIFRIHLNERRLTEKEISTFSGERRREAEYGGKRERLVPAKRYSKAAAKLNPLRIQWPPYVHTCLGGGPRV